MAERLIRRPVYAVALTALLTLGACSRSTPPAAGAAAATPSAQLANAAPATAPLAVELVSYRRGQGDTYDHRAHATSLEGDRHLAHERRMAPERELRAHRRWARHWSLRHHHLVFDRTLHGRASTHHAAAQAAPAVARPAALTRPHHQRIALTPTAQPVLLPQVKPLEPVTLALPLLSTQTSPAATPAQAEAAPAVDLATQLGQLTVAVAEVMKNARLDVPSALSTGGEGKVVLTLPPELQGALESKAGQVGLGPSARKAFVTARLAGQGYAITPNQEQTARLQAGEPTVFSWQVKPSATPGGVLTADMTGSLQGGGDDKTFALGAVTAQIPVGGQAAPAPAPIQAPVSKPLQVKLPDLSGLKLGQFRLPTLAGWKLRNLGVPGHPTLSVPGLGPVASYKVVAIGLLALALILLLSILRSANARRERAERRRRFHSFEASHFGEEHP